MGWDVAKATLEVALCPSQERWSVPNDEAGIAGLVVRLRPLAPHLVVADPRQIRDFAKGTGQLAKTD